MPILDAASRSISIAMCGEAICWSEATSFELVHLSHFALDDRRPVIELFDIGIGQRVLIEGTAQAPADADVLPGLHEEFDAFDRGHLGAQASDDLAGGFRSRWSCGTS